MTNNPRVIIHGVITREGQFSSGAIFLGGNCPGGNNPGDNCPGAIFLGGNCPDTTILYLMRKVDKSKSNTAKIHKKNMNIKLSVFFYLLFGSYFKNKKTGFCVKYNNFLQKYLTETRWFGHIRFHLC